MGRPPLDLVGESYGTLHVTARASKQGETPTRWNCRCKVCGAESVHSAPDLRHGRVWCESCFGEAKWPAGMRFEDSDEAAADLGSATCNGTMGRPIVSPWVLLDRELARQRMGRPFRDPNVQVRKDCEWRWERAARAFLGTAPPKPQVVPQATEPQPASDKQAEALATAARMVAKLRAGLDTPRLAA